MKYPHTGLYHFCLHLGQNLEAQQPPGQRICFYTPKSAEGLFGPDACYIRQRSLQKFRLPDTSGISLWHSTYQSTNYFPFRRRLKVVFTIHDLNFLYDKTKSGLKKRKYLDHIAGMARRADHVVAISNYTLQDVQQHIDLKGKPSSVIYNGCNIREAAGLQPPATVPDAPFLFTIGTIVDKKNFHVLPCLLAGNDRRLLIAGICQSEAYQQQILQEARRWKVEDRVVFLGAISENDKQWYLQHCTAFLFPSISEGFGLPVVEAMHFGKPVLLSNATSLPEIGGSEAYYFTGFEPEAMQQTLEDSLLDYARPGKAEAIRQRSLLFSWEESARQYQNLYSSLLA